MIKTKIQFSCEFYLLMISSNFNPDNVMAKKKKSFSGKEHKKSLMSALKKKKSRKTTLSMKLTKYLILVKDFLFEGKT